MDAQTAAREAAEALDKAIDSIRPDGTRNDADVLVANVAVHAAERAGATAADIAAHSRHLT